MRQDFSNVSKDKLAKLFPIILEEHNPLWKERYFFEKDFLKSTLGEENIVRINHIGSSAVCGLISKPTIDILLEITKNVNLQVLTEKMKEEGYIINEPPKDIIMYLKGYTPHGFEGQAVHIHVRYSGDWDELYFRDYLISHPDIAYQYGALKLRLRDKYLNDRDGYTEAKGNFIKKCTKYAKIEFPNKYTPVHLF